MTFENQITDAADAATFIRSGNAKFNIVSEKTGQRWTLMVQRKAKPGCKTSWAEGDAFYFVKVRTKATGDDREDYTYAGFLKADAHEVIAGAKGGASFEKVRRALSWSLGNFDRGVMPEGLIVQHVGQCGRCKRELTDPASINRGFGPECVKHLEG